MKSKILAFGKIVPAVVAVLLVAACSDGVGTAPPVTGGKYLKTFDSCGELNAALNAARVSIEEWEMDGESGVAIGTPAEEADLASPEGESDQGSPTQALPSVEEADIAKEDGDYVYVLHRAGKLVIFDSRDAGAIARIGEIDIEAKPIEMVVEGNMATIIASPFSGYAPGGTMGLGAYLVDISDRSAPALLREIELDGSYVDSKLVGATFHIVTSESLYYENDERPLSGDLMPQVRQTIHSGGATVTTDVATSCSNIYIPDPMRFDSYGDGYPVKTTRITSLSVSDADSEIENIVVAAMRPTVAASPSHLFLADWDNADDTTALHVFDIATNPEKAVLESSALFEGLVLNQFSIDQYGSMVRVAVTTNRNTAGSDDNDNRVLVFSMDSAGLYELGRVEDITPGESIWSARFVDERAFLVTFETIDPLITVDLADPRNPTVVGELEVPGVSTHIVMMDEDHLLTVGIAGTAGGVALQIFDVSDFANPQLAHRVDIEAEGDEFSSSEANCTHKAFSYFADEGLVALPIESWGWESSESDDMIMTYQSYHRSKMRIYRVDVEAGFSEAGVVEHDDLIPDEDGQAGWGFGLRRALMAGETLFTVSDYGLKAFGLDSFEEPLFSDYLGTGW